MKVTRKNEKGQTTVEWLMLMSVAFMTSYLMITGPMATFTRNMLQTIQQSLANVTLNGEMRPGEVVPPGRAGHPSDPTRFKALHL